MFSPSRYLRKRLKRVSRRQPLRAARELARWRQTQVLLAALVRDGSQPQGSTVASPRLSSSLSLPTSASNIASSTVPGYILCKSVKKQALGEMLGDLVAKNCIREMLPKEEGFFSRVFLVPKRSGNFRLVIDLSELNRLLAPVTFQMDTLAKVKQAAMPGMWATSLDLKDAYHHIPIHERSQQFLCFQVGNRRFRYLVLPFGLMSAPWVFTEVMKQIKRWSVALRMLLFQYIDDWLHLHFSQTRSRLSTSALLELCLKLGLLVNIAKSELSPTQSIVFLGERLDLQEAMAFTTQDRLHRLQCLLAPVLQSGSIPLARAEQLLGLLVATYPTVPYGRLFLRSFQWEVIRGIRRGR